MRAKRGASRFASGRRRSTFDASLVSAEPEAVLLRRVAPDAAGRIRVLANGVDAAHFDPAGAWPDPYPAGSRPVVFTGAMDYYANVDAVRWFAESAFPAVRAAVPDALFAIVGTNPAAPVRALARPGAILVTGRVEDVRPYLAHAAAVIAPLRIARGVQNKVLEAMAMARPLVATGNAVQGIPGAAQAGVIVRDAGSEFAAAVIEVLTRGSGIAMDSRRFVLDRHTWPTQVGIVSELLRGGHSVTRGRAGRTCGGLSMNQDPRHRSLRLAALAVLLGLLAISHRETLLAIGAKWFSDMTYSHGGLVVPISPLAGLALPCRGRGRRMGPSWWGVSALAAASLAWLVASAAGVLVVQELAVVAMVSSVVLALLGWQAYRQLAFPLGFLVFAVPFGRGLVPSLMQVTADITVAALRWTGVPVYRNGMLLSIPAGDFEVARACSGLNYLMAGIVLGTLYAYLTYSDWRKRIAFVAATVAVLVVANGIRAYLTVAVAHWSDMRYGTGYDHIVFGRVLFLAVIVAMFWIGQRWRDPEAAPRAMGMAVRPTDGGLPRRVTDLVVATCLLLIVGTPWYLSSATARSNAKAMLRRRRGARNARAGQGVAGPARRAAIRGARCSRAPSRNSATTYLDAAGP